MRSDQANPSYQMHPHSLAGISQFPSRFEIKSVNADSSDISNPTDRAYTRMTPFAYPIILW